MNNFPIVQKGRKQLKDHFGDYDICHTRSSDEEFYRDPGDQFKIGTWVSHSCFRCGESIQTAAFVALYCSGPPSSMWIQMLHQKFFKTRMSAQSLINSWVYGTLERVCAGGHCAVI